MHHSTNTNTTSKSSGKLEKSKLSLGNSAQPSSSSNPTPKKLHKTPECYDFTVPYACGCCAPGYTDAYFSFSCSYAHGRYALTGRFPHHVTGFAYSYVPVPVSRDSYCTCMCHGGPPRLFFVMLTISRLCLLLISGYDHSSFSRFWLRPYVTRTIRLSTLPPIYSYFCRVHLRFLRLFVLVLY